MEKSNEFYETVVTGVAKRAYKIHIDYIEAYGERNLPASHRSNCVNEAIRQKIEAETGVFHKDIDLIRKACEPHYEKMPTWKLARETLFIDVYHETLEEWED